MGLNVYLSYDPSPSLDIWPKDMKVCVHIKTCMGMLVSFVDGNPNWKLEIKCSSIQD